MISAILLRALVCRPLVVGYAGPADQRRGPVPAGEPDGVGPSVCCRGVRLDELLRAGGVDVHACEVTAPVQLFGPAGYVPDDGGPAGTVGGVVVLDVEIDAAAGEQTEGSGLAHRIGRRVCALCGGGGRLADDVCERTVGTGCLPADVDRQDSPAALRELADPAAGQLRLAARAVTTDVDPDGAVRRCRPCLHRAQ
jgi:hypothetical protein